MKKISISEIANKLNRQQGGIKARLKKLNVID
jgi:IS30 family transposase